VLYWRRSSPRTTWSPSSSSVRAALRPSSSSRGGEASAWSARTSAAASSARWRGERAGRASSRRSTRARVGRGGRLGADCYKDTVCSGASRRGSAVPIAQKYKGTVVQRHLRASRTRRWGGDGWAAVTRTLSDGAVKLELGEDLERRRGQVRARRPGRRVPRAAARSARAGARRRGSAAAVGLSAGTAPARVTYSPTMGEAVGSGDGPRAAAGQPRAHVEVRASAGAVGAARARGERARARVEHDGGGRRPGRRGRAAIGALVAKLRRGG